MEEDDHGKSLRCIFIFFIATSFQYLEKLLAINKRKASMSEKDLQLRVEIKRLLKESAALSQPSTFAQAAKLRRTAAAKEKELAKSQESLTMEMKTSFGVYERILMISKIVVFAVLTMWFWRAPVAAISKEIVQPFGWFLSWTTGDSYGDNVMIGIIPWLILSSKVGRYFVKKVLKLA
ncbi:protein GET1-like [Rutidosis leptorrhynchoides]|uniref:protein GET1-like n=1 Tax=Rutidosis leptorrhynchoides TaxID=125765 RepID=UPI003A98D0E4